MNWKTIKLKVYKNDYLMFQVSLGYIIYFSASIIFLSSTWALALSQTETPGMQSKMHVRIKVYLSWCLCCDLCSEFVCPSTERALPWPLVCIIIYLFQSIGLIETGSEGISGRIRVFGKIEYYVKKKVRGFRWYRLTTSTLMRLQTGGGSGRTRNVRSLAICIYLLHSYM